MLNDETNTENGAAASPIKPFVNWVGGKRKLLNTLISYIPEGVNNYYEPFLGGGALFFAVKNKFKQCFLSDINHELVTSYNAIKKNPEEIAKLYSSYAENHSREYYYKVRNKDCTNNPGEITARFLYLNRYCFKGIYRLNRSGSLGLTVSTKKINNTNVEERLKECSSFLKNASIHTIDFSFIEPQKDDFVYFDPPYHKAGERFYTRLPFNENDQTRLKDFATELDSKNVKFMLSNKDTDFIRNLYKDYNIHSVDIKYLITGQTKTSKEVIITNY